MNSSLLLLFPKWVQKVVVQSRELTIVLKNAAFILPVLETLQQHSTTQFKMLVDLTAVIILQEVLDLKLFITY